MQKGQTTKGSESSELAIAKSKKSNPTPTERKSPVEGGEKVPRASLRLVVSGLPPSLKKKAFKEVLRNLLPPGTTKKLELEVADKVSDTSLFYCMITY